MSCDREAEAETQAAPAAPAAPPGAPAGPVMVMDCKAKVTACRTRGQLSFAGTSSGAVRAQGWRTGKVWRLLRGHTGPVSSLAVWWGHDTVYSGGWDKRVLRWRASTREAVSLEGTPGLGAAHADFVKALLLSPDGGLLFSGGAEGALGVWDVRGLGGEGSATAVDASDAPGAPAPSPSEPSGSSPAGGAGKAAECVCPPHAMVAPHTRSIYDICHLPAPAVRALDGGAVGLVATASSDTTVRVVAYGTDAAGGPRATCVFAFHQGFETSVHLVAFAGGLLWTAGRDGHVRGFSLPRHLFDEPLDTSVAFFLPPLDRAAVEGNRAMEGEMRPEYDIVLPSPINGWSLDPAECPADRPARFFAACDDKWIYEVRPATGEVSRRHGPFLAAASTVQCVSQPLADPATGAQCDCQMVVGGGLDNSLRRFFLEDADKEKFLRADESSDLDMEDSEGLDPEVERLQQERLRAMLQGDCPRCAGRRD